MGQDQPCRVILDSGSQATLISEACVQRINLQRTHSKLQINGVGSNKLEYTRGKVKITVSSRFTNELIRATALILNKVTTDLPSQEVSSSYRNFFSNLQLADPTFDQSSKIDVLLGSDVFFDILTDGKLSHTDGAPTAHNSIFGWVIGGNISRELKAPIRSLHTCVDLDEQLQRFWQIEELPVKETLTEEEKQCEAHFLSTHTRLENGRYQVRLPFKESTASLGESKAFAAKRLTAMEKRFERNGEVSRQYTEFIREYINLGHMTPMSDDEKICTNQHAYYMPHHAVVKETSSTTRLRVVFDASCNTTTGISLNDKLMVGATIQDDLVTLLIRFRKHKIAFAADIAKMYRQIRVHEDDTMYQRILWRETPREPIQEYNLITVTYGTSSAPFLATRTLRQTALDQSQKFPLGSSIICSDFYVDDLMSGSHSVRDASKAIKELNSILNSAGFTLRKWSSNSPEVLQDIPLDQQETEIMANLDKASFVNTLGLKWNTVNDSFIFTVILPENVIATKRQILSDIARMYDPLGWISPCIVQAKILLQKLWAQDIDWDETLPATLADQWYHLRKDLKSISSLKIPRWIAYDNRFAQLHGFSDASEKAYAAAIYLKTVDGEENIHVHLVAAKTKVAPLKQQTLPRLELCGALLMTKLLKKVKLALQIPDIECHGWTDSTTVLAWLSDTPSRWKTFVGNRTAEILEVLPAKCWQHISSSDNPSDCASRGMMPSELIHNQLWWNGPSVLLDSTVALIPDVDDAQKEIINSEDRSIALPAVILDTIDKFIDRYSSLTRLIRITAWCRRFVWNCKTPKAERNLGSLSVEELNNATSTWIKMSQREGFTTEIQQIESGHPLSTKSSLISLNPFIDDKGHLRVGGRIQASSLSNNQRHPFILHKSHQLSEMIVLDLHIRHLHCGQQQLLCLLYNQYWIIGARQLVRRCVHKCVTCVKHRGRTYPQHMGNIPSHRLQPGTPFNNTGVDYAGPFMVRSWKGRGSKTYKAYVAVFICFSTRAVHLELTSEMTTEAFLAALKRFTSRRGLCSDIFSDNGTNFRGADRQLQELQQLLQSTKHNKRVNEVLSEYSIQWHFSPPHAPHFGGLWEAAVKSMKFHLRRIMGNAMLTFEEFSTLLCQIEACMNSRPLSPKSVDVDDLEALTPGHFLIGRPICSVPERFQLKDEKINMLKRWQYTQRLQQDFWQRWSKEYITQLQQRHKWRKSINNPSVGELVLIKDDFLPACQWSLGRITEVHPGKDKIVRVISIKTAHGIVKRPTIKVCPLPVDDSC